MVFKNRMGFESKTGELLGPIVLLSLASTYKGCVTGFRIVLIAEFLQQSVMLKIRSEHFSAREIVDSYLIRLYPIAFPPLQVGGEDVQFVLISISEP